MDLFYEFISRSEFKLLIQLIFISFILLIYSIILPRLFKGIKSVLESGARSIDVIDSFAQALSEVAGGFTSVLLGHSPTRGKNASERKSFEEKLLRLEAEFKDSVEQLRAENLRDKDGNISNEWVDAFIISRNRLTKESRRLSSGSINNLIMGILFTSASALSVLFLFFVYTPFSNEPNTIAFASSFLPRLTLVLLLQLSGSFFLKLYARSESELKSNKNEITNIEVKIASIMIATKNPDLIDISLRLIDQERNFIIEKDQKIASFSEKIDHGDLRSFITDLMKSKNSNQAKDKN